MTPSISAIIVTDILLPNASLVNVFSSAVPVSATLTGSVVQVGSLGVFFLTLMLILSGVVTRDVSVEKNCDEAYKLSVTSTLNARVISTSAEVGGENKSPDKADIDARYLPRPKPVTIYSGDLTMPLETTVGLLLKSIDVVPNAKNHL